MIWRLFCIGAVMLFISSAFLYIPKTTYEFPQVTENPISKPEQISEDAVEPIELFFVGDIMLGRGVEVRIEEEGMMYPFAYTNEILSAPDITIGNFEGIVNKTHTQTPSMTFQFSIRNEYLTQLRDVGFDVLSLANNHSFDYGEEALAHTRTLCSELTLICGGSPVGVDNHSVQTVTVGDEKLTFLFLHSLWSVPSDTALDLLFAEVEEGSTLEIAYVHWGDEYVLVHNSMQEELAQKLIDRGVDTVIGHHPHVVQDIAFYKGKPIFYSLGNFIFDQYFSEDVQEGLGVRLTISKDENTYTLVPFTSKESRNQPRIMEDPEKQRLFTRILENVGEYAGVSQADGVIRVFR